jgi:hypothetical protein
MTMMIVMRNTRTTCYKCGHARVDRDDEDVRGVQVGQYDASRIAHFEPTQAHVLAASTSFLLDDSNIVTNPTHQPPYPMSYMGYSTPPTKLNPLQTGNLSKPYSPRHKIADQDQFHAGRLEESGVVPENYENINKCVYHLFYNRPS